MGAMVKATPGRGVRDRATPAERAAADRPAATNAPAATDATDAPEGAMGPFASQSARGVDEGWRVAPSPCIGVCRYEERRGRCVGCAMTTHEKHAFKRGEDAALRRRTIVGCVRRLARHGGLMRWLSLYAAKCRRLGARDMTRTL